KDYTRYLLKKYKIKDYYPLAFLGDSVLYTILGKMAFDNLSPNLGSMTDARHMAGKNTSFFCLLQKFNICDKVIKKDNYRLKECADMLESIVGLLYFYLTNIKKMPNSMDILNTYFINTFY